ncbi:MAG: S1C family serine protease [Gemmataceae bacterium]
MSRIPVLYRVCLVAATASVLVGANAKAQYARRTAVVKAVEKTEASIVTIRIPRTRYQIRDTIGTGVIIDERGYIITNHHVVSMQGKVKVEFHDATKAWAQVLKTFPQYDLAVLRTKPSAKLKALTLGPIDDLMVGERVIAIGNPFGFTHTVSMGIISALNRNMTTENGHKVTGVIQTDATVNPGNSGGPLLNINGELIGINTAIHDGARGIAFAINAGTVRNVLRKHFSALKIAGVGHGMACQDTIVGEGGDRQKVEIVNVSKDTPAAKARLQEGDVILSIAQRRVKNTFDVERALWGMKPGQTVSVTVQRDDEERTVQLVLGNRHSRLRTAQGSQKTNSTNLSQPPTTKITHAEKALEKNASVKQVSSSALSSKTHTDVDPNKLMGKRESLGIQTDEKGTVEVSKEWEAPRHQLWGFSPELLGLSCSVLVGIVFVIGTFRVG